MEDRGLQERNKIGGLSQIFGHLENNVKEYLTDTMECLKIERRDTQKWSMNTIPEKMRSCTNKETIKSTIFGSSVMVCMIIKSALSEF